MWPEQVGWLVPLPQYFSQDPYPQILLSLRNHGWETRGLGPSNRLGSSGDGLVGVGKTRSSDPTENCTNAIPRAGAGLLEGGCLIWVYQFLNGSNPMLLRCSNHLPARLEFPPGMEELQAQLEELQVWT